MNVIHLCRSRVSRRDCDKIKCVVFNPFRCSLAAIRPKTRSVARLQSFALIPMLPRSKRLQSAQFNHAFAHSQSVRHPLMALKAHARGDDSGAVRAAFVVPKKQAKAAGRNRTRRRLRERYRLHPRRDELKGCDLIFLTTPATPAATSDELDAALDEVLRRMKRKLGDSRNVGLATVSKLDAKPLPRLEEGASPAPRESTEPTAATSGEQKISVFAFCALSVIRFYQRFISPGLPPSCRFYPSCSRYTYGAIERFGLARGLWLGTYRVCRCHPWNAGGIDEVPAQFPPFETFKERAVAKIKSLLTRRRFDSPRN